MWFRLNKARKSKTYALRSKGQKVGNPTKSLTESKEHAEHACLTTTQDVEVIGEDAQGEFVAGVATVSSDIEETVSPDLKKAYQQSLETTSNLQNRLLEGFTEDQIDGIAKALASLQVLADTVKKVKKEPGTLTYKVLQRIYTGDLKYEKYPMPAATMTMAWTIHQWSLTKGPFEVVKEVRGIGRPKTDKITGSNREQPLSVQIDRKDLIIHLNPFVVGTLPSGRKFLVIVENSKAVSDWDYSPASMTVVAAPDIIEEAVLLVREEMKRHDIYRNRFIFVGATGMSVLSKFDSSTWADVVPIPELKSALDYIRDCILQVDLLAAKGLYLKEGLLVSGQPGIGKSVSVKVSLNELAGKCTIFVVEKVGDIRGIYEMAHYLAPAIVLLEDVDMIAGDRREGGRVLSDLLSVLSGATEYKNVITIATTNFPELVDKAIKERPGRFDNHVKVPALSRETKQLILDLYLKKFEVPVDQWAKIREIFEPLSRVGSVGAHIEKFVETAVKRATVQQRPIDPKDFEPGVVTLKSVAEADAKAVGFSGSDD